MNLKEQKYICELADTQSLSLAAKQLYISQPALSLYVSNLESNLGVKLFDRVGKRFLLTHMGELYVQKARQMLDLKLSFDIELNGAIQGYKERLRIGMQDIRSCFISPAVIDETSRRFPNIDLILYEQNYRALEELLVNNQIDMFFCNYLNQKKEFNYIPVYSDELMLIINKSNPRYEEYIMRKDNGEIWVDLNRMKDEKFILQNEGQSVYAYCQQLFKQHNFAPKRICTIRKILTMVSLVNYNYGIGFCSQSYINYAENVDNIQLCHVSEEPIQLKFAAIYKKDYEPTPVALEVIKMIEKMISTSYTKSSLKRLK